MKAFIIGLIAVIVIGGGGYLVLHKSPAKSPTSNTQSQSSSSATNQSSPNTITFDGSMFSPAVLTVKAGSTVTVKNNSSQDMQFDSDPHPVHTDDTDLNAGMVAPGKSVTFTVTKTGTYGYHDHLDPSITGKITVE